MRIKYTPNGNFSISLQIWVRLGLQNLRLVPFSTYEFRVICDSESHSLLYGVNEFLSILTFLPISITLDFMFILCLWFRASLIYINLYAPCILYIGQTYRSSPEYSFYIFSQQIYLINFGGLSLTIFFYSPIKCHVFPNITLLGS